MDSEPWLLNPLNQLILTLVLAIPVTWIGVHFSQRAKRKRLMKKAPLLPINEVEDGNPARVIGQLVYGEHRLKSPATNRECAVYEIIVEHIPPGQNEWALLVREVFGADFLLDDNTGRARIAARTAKVVMNHDHVATEAGEVEPHLAEFLTRQGQRVVGNRISGTLRVSEGILEEGESVAVTGVGQWTGPQGRPREKVLAMSGSEDAELYVSDDPLMLK